MKLHRQGFPLALAVFVQVLEELFARNGLALPDDARQPAIADVHAVRLAALSAKLEAELRAGDLDVPVAQRGEAERPVGARGDVKLVHAKTRRREEVAFAAKRLSHSAEC